MQEQQFDQKKGFQKTDKGNKFQGPQPGQEFKGPQTGQSVKRSGFDFKGFFSLIRDVKPRFWQLWLGLGLGLVATIMQLMVPKLAQKLINQLGHNVDMTFVAGVVALFVLSAAVSAISGTTLGIFGENVVAKLRDFLWDKILRLPVGYFDDHKAGEISSRLVNDSTQVKDLLANTLPNMVTSLLQLVGAMLLMVLMDWKMTLLMFIVVPVVILIALPIGTRSRTIAIARQDELASFSGEANEVISETRLMKSSTAENVERESGHQKVDQLYHFGMKEAVYDSIAGPLMTMAMMGMVVGILAYGASRVAQGTMTMGTMFSFLMYLVQLIGPFTTLGQFFSSLAKASGSTTRIQDLMSVAEEDRTVGDTVDAHGQTLSVNDVNFAYDPGEPILHDVSFKAEPNTVIAFAGPSGGGKSTIFSLLERFYQPESGAIKIGATNIANVNLTNWRQQIGLVGQDAAVLAGTIRYNLTYGLDGEYSDEQLWDVLEMAYAKDFVKNMSTGLNTQIGERGVKLSGGQRQRIAIARAFLRDPQILMLDEATASLDAESEMMVQKALNKLMHNRTTLVIAHRLSTIVNADQIYFIENGTVSGHGTHDYLVEHHELYREYVENQFGGEKKDVTPENVTPGAPELA
ncbi:multidrug ABC transporter permease [Loigolactobacillus backii]|uniref:ABC transporter ATP-binding protein n=1 Tax=Loigolactobacillus backii TaxID=375175 RepID=UPI000C1CB24D|nr:ABC transporter ATP-binding protein [Loigolactobacillus backii]PIO84152.1 multidrug ABC transporter permease [Loigolactobacillus backii]